MTEPGFPIEWGDPSDADLTWEWDDMHMPRALTPLAGDYVRTMASGFPYRYQRLEVPFNVQVRIWNGYAFFSYETTLPESEPPLPEDTLPKARRAHIDGAEAYWHGTAIPEVSEIYAWVAARPVETATPAELAATWDEVWTRIGRCWSIHFYSICGPYQVLDDLADLYESIVPDASPAEALELISGGQHELHDVELRLERLAAMVPDIPMLAERLAEPEPTIARVAEIPGAAAFVAELDGFIAEHGHLGQAYDDLSLASWIEDPGTLMAEIAKRAESPPAVGADERRARQIARAAGLAEGVRERTAADPALRERFESLLATAHRIGPLTEIHNYWIDRMAQSTLRRFVMRVAHRLAAAGAIAEPDDVLFLRRHEIGELIVAPADRREVVAERRETFRRWAAVRPPRYIGKPGGPANDRFDGSRFDSADPDVLQGTGASAGIARGIARVTRSPADFDRVEAGDIIVCASSNPSWVPLFNLAGGLVTDTGGVLSHAAVVAREFGLPAVVGTGDATVRVADGRLIELDGSTGTVRLL